MRNEERGPGGCLAIGAVVFALLFAGAWLVGGPGFRSNDNDEEKPDKASQNVPVPMFFPRAMEVTRGVHLLGGLSPGAAYAIETADGLVLIDTGLDADAGPIVSQFTEAGLAVDDLELILLTHVHADHSLGARRLRDLSGAKIFAGTGDVSELEDGNSREAFFSTYEFPSIPLHPTPIDEQLEDGRVFEFGRDRLQCIATPGHTPGSFCFVLERDGRRLLFTGDTVSSLTGEMGTYAARLSPSYRADAEDYLASLQRLRELPPPHLVLPGHPSDDRQGQSAEVNVAQWHRLLDGGIQELETLVAQFETDGRNFLDGNPKRLLPGLLYLGEFHDWAICCLKTDEQLFVFDAPGGPGLDAFLHERLAQLDVEAPSDTTVVLTACDAVATAGLVDLVDKLDCTVVAPEAGLPAVRETCPVNTRFVAAEVFAAESSFPVRVIALEAVGEWPVAYEVRWAGKTLLLPGRMLTRVSGDSVRRVGEELNRLSITPQAYLNSVRVLRALAPDLWLPAWPVHGQNANLYEGEWRATVIANRNAFRQ